MKYLKYVLLLSIYTASYSVQAEGVKFAFELGLHSGGDEITAAATTTGTETVTAGGGISLAAGINMELVEELHLQTTFGFKEDAINASNGNISFSRNTVDVLLQKQINDSFYIGGGGTYHSGVELRSDGLGAAYVQDEDFENAFGFLADAKFDVGEPDSFFLALRLTLIEYKSKTSINGKSSYSGNSIGLIWGGQF